MIALTLPWVCLILLCLICLFAYKRWWIATAILLVAMVAINWFGRVFPINLFCCASGEDVGTLKVMTFNVNGKDTISGKPEQLAHQILNEDADIVFLAEDFGGVREPLDSLLRLYYSYSTIGKDKEGHYLYSRFPIDTTYIVRVQRGRVSRIHPAIFDINGQKLKIYGVHLASNNYTESREYFSPDNIETTSQAHSYLKDIHLASEFRCREADSLLADYSRSTCCLNRSNATCIIMGDFNDVCGSPTLRILEKGGFEDAWWKGGLGYGATIHHPLPYRIDHIMYNDKLKLKSIKKIDAEGISDHDALMAEFSLR